MPIKKPLSLDGRVQAFEEVAEVMIARLDDVVEKLSKCESAEQVEDLKLEIAPDAATLISQGDTLVLETNGRSMPLSQRVMKVQYDLREKFRMIQSFA